MKRTEFAALVREASAGLQSRFGLRLARRECTDWSETLSYKNDTTGLIWSFELRESTVVVFVCRLVADEVPMPKTTWDPRLPLHCYDLNDLLSIRNPEAPQHGPLYADYLEAEGKRGFRVLIELFVRNVEIYAADILSGDFTIFSDVDRIVKERMRRLDPFSGKDHGT